MAQSQMSSATAVGRAGTNRTRRRHSPSPSGSCFPEHIAAAPLTVPRASLSSTQGMWHGGQDQSCFRPNDAKWRFNRQFRVTGCIRNEQRILKINVRLPMARRLSAPLGAILLVLGTPMSLADDQIDEPLVVKTEDQQVLIEIKISKAEDTTDQVAFPIVFRYSQRQDKRCEYVIELSFASEPKVTCTRNLV